MRKIGRIAGYYTLHIYKNFETSYRASNPIKCRQRVSSFWRHF